MRCAYVCADPGVPVYGRKGASVHVQEVVRALRRQGAAVTLFASRLDGGPPPDLADLPLVPLPHVGKGPVRSRERRALAANAGLTEALERHGPFDVVYERYSLWSVAGMAYAAATGTPGLLEVNAPLIDEHAAHRGLVDRESAERVATGAFAAATAVVAVSASTAEWAARRAPKGSRIAVVPNGVDPDRFAAAAAGREPRPGRFTVGFVGTLKPWHGLDTLLDAVAVLRRDTPAADLLLVGDGPERAALERRARALGLTGVTAFTGAVAPEDVPELLARMDVGTAAYPALDDCYFSPLKLFEYLAAGLPVVAARIGQVPEVVHDGRTGLLCRPGDPTSLAACLRRLHRHPQLRLALGRAGRELVAARHTWDAVARRILELARTGTPTGVS